MMAVRLHEFGPAEGLTLENIPDPVPGPGQVRIEVRAAGVHLLDTALVAGAADQLPFPLPPLPLVPGREVAGVVDRVGDGVDRRWLGRRVVTHLGLVNGGYAELAIGVEEALFEVAEDLSFEAAVAMVGTGRTAMSLLHIAALSPDDVVVVTAAAGGVGNLLVQAARNLGATTVGLAGGPHKVARVRALGATVAADYDDPDWPAAVRTALGGREATVVLDGVGGTVGRSTFDVIGLGGRMILFGWSAGTMTELTTADLLAKVLTVTVALGPRLTRVPGGLRAMQAAALAEAAAGRLVPLVQTFPLTDAARAQATLAGRGTVGKVVLVPAGAPSER